MQICIPQTLLKNNKCADAYFQNFNKEVPYVDFFENLLKQDYFFAEAINYAFTWCLTPQKHDYWLAIDQAWKKIINNERDE